MRLVAVLVLAGALAGCDTIDRPAGSEFEPIGTDRFRYEAVADAIYPADSAGAEQDRMRWLATWLADNTMCPTGYEITERKPVLIVRGALGDGYRIYYRGRCKS